MLPPSSTRIPFLVLLGFRPSDRWLVESSARTARLFGVGVRIVHKVAVSRIQPIDITHLCLAAVFPGEYG